MENPKVFIWKNDKLIGTGGTTFRTKAIKQVNGFDESIKGAGEDTDLILRIKKAGWLLQPNMAELYELHSGLSKPKDLWKKYFWYGYGCQKSFQPNWKRIFSAPHVTHGGFCHRHVLLFSSLQVSVSKTGVSFAAALWV